MQADKPGLGLAGGGRGSPPGPPGMRTTAA